MYAMIHQTWVTVPQQTRCFPQMFQVCLPCFIGDYLSEGCYVASLYES